jgi:hypothetical protein
MTDAAKTPGTTPTTTPKSRTTTELDDAALDKISGGATDPFLTIKGPVLQGESLEEEHKA